MGSGLVGWSVCTHTTDVLPVASMYVVMIMYGRGGSKRRDRRHCGMLEEVLAVEALLRSS